MWNKNSLIGEWDDEEIIKLKMAMVLKAYFKSEDDEDEISDC